MALMAMWKSIAFPSGFNKAVDENLWDIRFAVGNRECCCGLAEVPYIDVINRPC
jgi:hypothetical protein